jgi:hypothetical protein
MRLVEINQVYCREKRERFQPISSEIKTLVDSCSGPKRLDIYALKMHKACITKCIVDISL